MKSKPDDIGESQLIRQAMYDSPQLLIVEDDELLRDRLDVLLTQESFNVHAVGSATEARQAMEAMVFPIVIIDRMLGDGDGIQLIAELRTKYSSHRVFLVLFSALDSPEERAKGLEAGADAYVSKRAESSELIETLTAARSIVRYRK